MKKVVVISGGSSGIGKATAERFAAEGHIVYELSRSGKEQNGIFHLDCDICSEEAIDLALKAIGEKEGRIDCLVANAGFGISGPFTDTSEANLIRQYDVNVFGAARLVKAAFPYLLKAKDARVLFVSSVAADVAIPFQTHYSATKACLKMFALALDNEWKPHGIRALALLPGDVSTPFTANRIKLVGDERADRSVARMEADEKSGGGPETVANRIYQLLIKKKNPKVVSSLGVKYVLVLLLFKLLPIRLSNYIIGMLYSK
ncbi:MAG TPA: SDR family NAD(P)-dependent oxidoreductase [Fastidiosipila sp.]|jgi:NAD(P)-dependent dehydrogenase (short-subunit alcohol dehydrogenase family)|nr:SDR family NAD(P)-dependent oxidoreductase [Fastidiosipila sp.]